MAIALSGRAQLTVVGGAATLKTPEQLVAEWLIGNGVSISNVTFNGSGAQITSNQIGTFETEGEALAELNLEAGILMNSGSCQNAVGPNGNCGTTANTGSGSDPDLNILAAPNSTNDKAVLEFDFIPESDTILFRYVFGSEEFYNYCNSNYNDVFGFFLSGPGISGPFSNNAVNIALMPGSSNYVGINNLCDDFLSNWCNAPVLCPPTNIYENCNNPLGNGENFQYNGLTYVFTATYVVIPCSTYHIKLAIADAGDSSLDSGVFLEKNSFSAVGLSINTNFTMPSLGERTIEGCADAIVSFILPEATPTPYVINFNIGGTAINGVDYTQIPDSVVIPAGEDSVGLVIHPLFDGIPEGVETVILEIVQPGCFGSQYIYDTILIYDNTPFFVNGGEDDTICAGDSATLEATAWGGQRPYDYNWEGIGGDDSIVKVSPPPGTYEYVILVEEGCGVEESDTMELLVKPIPSISTGPFNDTICSGDTLSIPLIASITGSAISWTATNLSGNISGHSPGSGDTISQQLFNTSYLLDSLEYTVGATIDGCPGHDTSIWVFVRPLPDLVFTPPELGICNGQTTAIALSSNVANTNFSWTATSGNPNISGYNDGAGDTIQQTLFTSDPASDTVSYHVTANSNGCNSQVTDYPVIVNPVPLVTVQPMWDTICSYEFTNIQLSASCFGTNFSWIATQGVGNITGFSDGSGSQINQQLTNPLSTIGSVVYSITPYTSSCTGQDTNFTMWVKPTPLVTNVPLGDSICNNATLNLLLTSDVSGATFTWTCTPSSANLTGWSEQPTPSTLINQTFSNNGYDIETVTYHITPDFSGCSGPVTDYIVTVYPTPDLSNNPASHSQCNGQIVGGQPGGLPLQSNVANTTFTWRAFSNSPNISGFFDHTGMGATAIEDTLVNSGFTVDTVTYRILPSANGCDGDSTDYLVVVFPTPDLSNQATTQSQCNGQPTGLFLQSNVSGTLFTWTAFGSSLFVTGFSNSIAPGTLIDQTLVNSGYEVDTVTYLIVPQINGCEGDTIPFTVVVFPVADMIFVPDGDTICSRQPTGISLQSNVAGTTFSWNASGSSPEISGYSTGTGNLIQQVLYNAGYLPGWVTYQVTPTANGCIGTQNSAVVTVDPVPVVSLSVCFDTVTITTAKPIRLHGGIPLTGTYSGPGVDQPTATLYPGIAGAGSHQITYNYINDFDCTDSSSLIIHITNPVSHICGDTLIDLRDSLLYPTVDINGQCWMAANLNYGTPIASNQMQRDNCVNEKYCYNDNPANCISFGGLYKWDELMSYTTNNGVQGLCPPGWHIPTEAEWNILFAVYISSGFAGSALKIIGYSGFDALLSGIRFHNNIWKFPGNDPILRSILYWSSTIHGPDKAWAHGMNEVATDIDYTPSVSFYPALRSNAFAVRCLKD